MTDSVSKMVLEKIEIGQGLEITLCRGATYDNGWTPAPTVDPQGFYKGPKTSDEDGPKVLGYLAEIQTERNKIFIDQTHGTFTDFDEERETKHPLRRIYISGDVIRSYKVLGN